MRVAPPARSRQHELQISPAGSTALQNVRMIVTRASLNYRQSNLPFDAPKHESVTLPEVAARLITILGSRSVCGFARNARLNLRSRHTKSLCNTHSDNQGKAYDSTTMQNLLGAIPTIVSASVIATPCLSSGTRIDMSARSTIVAVQLSDVNSKGWKDMSQQKALNSIQLRTSTLVPSFSRDILEQHFCSRCPISSAACDVVLGCHNDLESSETCPRLDRSSTLERPLPVAVDCTWPQLVHFN